MSYGFPVRPWAPELFAATEHAWSAYPINKDGRYFFVPAFRWALSLCEDGSVCLAVRADDGATLNVREHTEHTFPTLHEAYLTGMLLFPEDFPPLGH